MEKFFAYINTLKQVVMIRQESMFYERDGVQVANCTVLTKGQDRVEKTKEIFTRSELETYREITLDEVYHTVANVEVA